MTWIVVPVPPEEVTAETLFELSKKHRLVPENMERALSRYANISSSCAVIEVEDSRDGTKIATLIISSIVDGEDAQVDLIPVSKFFSPVGKDGNKNEDPFLEKIEAALGPVFRRLIKGRELRRLTAMLPKTHSRAFKILRECGFKKEGVMRDAVKFNGKEIEDIVIMGMLADKE